MFSLTTTSNGTHVYSACPLNEGQLEAEKKLQMEAWVADNNSFNRLIVRDIDTKEEKHYAPTKGGLVRCRMYGWTITKDYRPKEGAAEGTNDNAKGLCGPRHSFLATAESVKNHPKAEKFRMLDDDDNVLYEGLFVDGGPATGFEPKDDFGEPNAGCTVIQYWQNRKWQTL